MPVILDHEQKTGKKVMYAFGISPADPDEMMRNHDLVRRSRRQLRRRQHQFDRLWRHDASCASARPRACTPIATAGTSSPGIPASAWSSRAYQQFWRLLGVDQFQINGIRAKYWEPDESFVRSFHDVHDADLLRRRPAAAGGLLRPVGRPGVGDLSSAPAARST